MDIEQDAYREVMSFRERVEDRAIDLDAAWEEAAGGETPEAEAATVADGGHPDASRAEFEAALWNDLFDVESTGEPRQIVSESFGHLADGDWEAAESLLREHFESVCERKDPVLQNEAHPAACHLYDQPN
jgi:peptide/nickel transport system ATP-binding protein